MNVRRPNIQSYPLRATVAAAVALTVSGLSMASSHREAPSIAMEPTVDATDFYMFRSYEAGRAGYVTLLANYIPFQDPQGGPNFYQFNPNALYEIHVDNNGDAKEDITFQFRFKSTSKSTSLNVGGKQIGIPLIQSGGISGINPASLNVRETYSVDIVRGDRRTGTHGKLTAVAGGASEFDKPVDNIGDKTFGSATAYEAYANQHIVNVTIPGCGNGRLFVGQRKEPFYIAVGKIFDLVNLNPLGAEVGGNKNDLENKNVSTLALEIPIECLISGTDPVIGGYTTASLRQGRLINGVPPATGLNKRDYNAGSWTQVSRLGMPLVNEVVIGVDAKDRFNSSKPKDDAQFADFVTNPTLPALIETLFPAAKAPTNFPRTDLVTVFLKGIAGVNQPSVVVASEMLRLNTSIAPAAINTQNALGVAAGDNAGFPNGRRPADDVVDLSIRVAMGALCVLTTVTDALHVGCKPIDAPAGGLAFTDGVRKTSADFQAVFPYLNTPLPGNFNN